MDFSTIALRIDGPRAAITLARPEKLNPLSTLTLQELAHAARALDEHEDLKAVVVSGAGRAFSAGADISALAAAAEGSDAERRRAADAGRLAAEAIEGMRAVTIASIHGHCVGGGVVLAAACDLRVADEATRFSIPELDLGIPLAWGGIPRLVREIGPAMTRELVLTCRPFGAQEARAIGFLNRVAPAGQLDAVVEELLSAVIAKSAFTVAATKRAVNAAAEQLASTDGAWSDADLLLAGVRDEESRAVAVRYLEGLGRR